MQIGDYVEYNVYICILYIHIFEARRISGPLRYANGEWRRLHNEELHSWYHSPNIVRMIKSRKLRWESHVARMEDWGSFKILTGTPLGKIPLGRPRRR